MNQIDSEIQRLRRLLDGWKDEVAEPKSAMSPKDIRWLEIRINNIIKIRTKLIEQIKRTEEEIKIYTSMW